MTPNRSRMLVTSLLAALWIASESTALGQATSSKQWALLIGAEAYEKAPPLQYIRNDVRQLANALIQNGGFAKCRVIQITDDGQTPEQQPRKTPLEAALPKFLEQPGPDDSVIVYFSGHGFKDKDGKLYLAPLDCDPANPVATCVSAEWFREQLDRCKAGFKLLILDSCHAGAEKAVESTDAVSAKDLSELFKTSVGVVTLASSTADEKSQIWPFKQQSLFSYWLTQGLKGHADNDGNGSVNVDELYQYLFNHVRQTAQIRLGRAQTPVRIIGSRVPGTPDVVQLRPQGLTQVLADMADQIAGLMEERQLASIGVPEFTSDGLGGETLGGDFGLLGHYCAKQLEDALVQRSAGKFSVVDRKRLQTAMKTQRFTLASFESSQSLASLSKTLGGMPIVARGSLYDRAGHIMNLRCKLVETEGDKAIGSVGGVAQLNESQWAMIGRSVEIRADDRRPDGVRPGEVRVPTEQRVIERADARANGDHPMKDPNFAFPLRMMIVDNPDEPLSARRYTERKPVFHGNDCIFPVRLGEVYELRMENRDSRKVLMRLLVDGLNTCLEKETDTKGLETYVIGKRVSLDEARYWVLDPKDPLAGKGRFPVWAIRGFVSKRGANGEYRRFEIGNASDSLAARQEFTEQIGIITAAFYLSKGTSRGQVGTIAGQAERDNLRIAEQEEVGQLLAVVHLRYLDESAVADLTSAGRR